MNIRKFMLPALLIWVALAIASCALVKGGIAGAVPGSGNFQSEIRDTGTFQAITVEYPLAEIIIRQGNEEIVQIEADDNLLPQISTEVSSGKLTIASSETDWNARVNPSRPVNITITVRDLKEIEYLAPAGSLEVNDLQADTLRLVLSGGAQVRLNRVQVDLLDSVLSGAGDIQVNGTAEEIKLILSGLGNFNAAELKSNKATIELSGMGDATVSVEEELTATITGAGSIKYIGNPHVEQNVNGAGSVKPAE